MSLIDELRAANEEYVGRHVPIAEARPVRHLAVLTCMDARIDVFAVLGLRTGDAHVIRNAGGRVTDDMLRSLAVSTHVLGVDTLVVMQHTKCGMAGVSDDELQRLTTADLEFLTIDDHTASLQHDVDQLSATPYLDRLRTIAGVLYDLESGRVDEIVHWQRARTEFIAVLLTHEVSEPAMNQLTVGSSPRAMRSARSRMSSPPSARRRLMMNLPSRTPCSTERPSSTRSATVAPAASLASLCSW